MNSSLSGLGDFDNEGIHEAFLSNLYALPQIDYERNGWRASLSMSLKWLHYSVAGQHDYVNASPRLYVRLQLTAKSDISGSVAYSLGSPQPYLNITAPVLSDYRNLFIAENPDKYSQRVAATISYRYRNPLKSLFFNLSSTYNHSRDAIMSNQLFIGDFIVSTYVDLSFITAIHGMSMADSAKVLAIARWWWAAISTLLFLPHPLCAITP